MKKLILGIAVLGSILMATGTRADSTFGHEVPFPLSAQIPIPWNTIEGVWQAREVGMDSYFSFEVQNNTEGSKFLRVYQLDPQTRQIVAAGAGFASADQRIVRAAMKGTKSTYLIFVRAFKCKRDVCQGMKTATVLTVRPMNASSMEDEHFVLRKVSGRPILSQRR